MVKVRGDDVALHALIESFVKAAGTQLRTAIMKNLQEEALKLVREGFQKGKDPYGVPWRKLKKQRGRQGPRKGKGDRILVDTGALRNSFTRNGEGPTEFRIGSNVQYAASHQYGTLGHKAYTRFTAITKKGKFSSRKKAEKRKRGSVAVRALNFKEGGGKIFPRPMVPTEIGGLGPVWTPRFVKISKKMMTKHFKGK